MKRPGSRVAGGRHARPWLTISVSALLATLLVAALAPRDFLENVELALLDARFRSRGPIPTRDDIVVVAIDQTSETDLATPYPWDRRLQARLVDNLSRAGARLIVFDVLFTETRDPADNVEFAEAIRRAGNVILSGQLEVEKLREGMGEVTRLVPPIPELAEAAWGWGLAAAYSDTDDGVRRYRTVTPDEAGDLSSLGIQVIKAMHGLPPDLAVERTKERASFGGFEIPLYDRFNFLINYRGPAGCFHRYSYSNVLDDEAFDLPNYESDTDVFDMWLAKDVFKDKIVLVGYTGSALHDFVRTPFFTQGGERVLTPGVEMHAHAVETILAGDYIFRPVAKSQWFRPLLALLWAVLVCSLAARVGVLTGLGLTLALSAAEVGLAFWLFEAHRFWLDIVSPVMATTLAYSIETTWTVVREQRDKRMIRAMFAHYVPEKLVNEIIRRPDQLMLGGEERELTVLFSDVEGFTTISEQMRPRELANHLNSYLTEMSDVVLQNEGIIDKFEGDAIMAEFGAPVHFPDHAAHACRAALGMQSKLIELARVWEAEGLHPWRARVGIHTGNVIVGNMGSRELFDYTVIGDNVNLGARLETANKIYGTRIMISEATWKQTGEEFLVRELDDIVVKGKTKPVKVYELVAARASGVPPERERLLRLYAQGMEAAAAGNLDSAIAAFRGVVELDPGDGPSHYHLKRLGGEPGGGSPPE